MTAVKQTRAAGDSEIVDTITPGVSGVGVAFRVSELTWVAFSFGAISSRLDAPRRAEMGALLRAECEAWGGITWGDGEISSLGSCCIAVRSGAASPRRY